MRPTQPRTFRHPSFHGRIGIARADITPPIGIYARNWGAAKHDEARSIHRPLTLTAVTLTSEAGEPSLTLVEADLGWWKSPSTFSRFQKGLLHTFSAKSGELILGL